MLTFVSVPRAVRLRFVEEVWVPHFCQNTVAAVPHIDLHVVWIHANQSAVHGIINELKLVFDGVRKLIFMHLECVERAIVHVLLMRRQPYEQWFARPC